MTKWFFRWWHRGFQKMNEEQRQEMHAIAKATRDTCFEGGMHFQIIDAQNGKILKVMVPCKHPQTQFQSHTGTEEKLWVIPEGENVIEFVTRALVEERLK
jgi:hypothetical protein